MQELIYVCLYLGILVGLLALIVAIPRYYHTAQPRTPDQKAPAPSEAALDTAAVPQFEPVLITFIADTPWGNAGETLPGALTRMDFPVSLALAARSRAEFLHWRDYVRREFPQVRTIYFWPKLSPEAGYYPGTWSDADAVQHMAMQSAGLPVLWD